MAKKTEKEVKETKKEAAVMDDAAKEKFQQKLKDLLALAKKKKNMLEYQEISDFFADMQLEAEQFDKILDFLEANNIDDIKAKTEALTEKFHTISAKMYQQAQAAQQQGQTGASDNNGAADESAAENDNVVDADFEVVDDDNK